MIIETLCSDLLLPKVVVQNKVGSFWLIFCRSHCSGLCMYRDDFVSFVLWSGNPSCSSFNFVTVKVDKTAHTILQGLRVAQAAVTERWP